MPKGYTMFEFGATTHKSGLSVVGLRPLLLWMTPLIQITCWPSSIAGSYVVLCNCRYQGEGPCQSVTLKGQVCSLGCKIRLPGRWQSSHRQAYSYYPCNGKVDCMRRPLPDPARGQSSFWTRSWCDSRVQWILMSLKKLCILKGLKLGMHQRN